MDINQGQQDGQVRTMTTTERAPLVWTNIAVFALTMLAAVVAVPWFGIAHGYSTAAWVSFVVFLCLIELSVTAGYHRLWSHRAYDAHWSVRLAYMLFGAMALQNSILIWSSNHRNHHSFVDDNARDPYSAKRGFWFSHIGWMLRDYPSGRSNFANARDLQRDPIVMFQHRYYLPLALTTNFGLTLLTGWLCGDVWGVFLLGGVLRVVVSHHFTFFINSLAHMWGKQPYSDRNTARDNGVLAFLTFGEGYHNFHHLYGSDYRNGVRWWQWDPTKWLIRALAALKLARNLKRMPDVLIQRARLQMQLQRIEARLKQAGSRWQLPDPEKLREQLAAEYQALAALVSAWSKAREAWIERTRAGLAERWERTRFRRETRAVLSSMRELRRRLTLLQAQLQFA
jgi:stearoyl-CoA desaturase (delta-9 desaturase)